MQDHNELPHIPIDHLEQLSPLLQAEELVLWTGRPHPETFLRTCYSTSRLYGPVFGIALIVVLVAVFASLVIMGAIDGLFTSEVGFFAVSIVVLALFTVWELHTRRTVLAKALGVLYAVTDRRLIVLLPPSAGFLKFVGGPHVRDYGRGAIRFVHVHEHRNGTGNIAVAGGFGLSLGLEATIPINGFAAIEDPYEVAELIREQDYAPHASETAPFLTRNFARR